MPVSVVVGLKADRAAKIAQQLASTGWQTVNLDEAKPNEVKQIVFLEQDTQVPDTYQTLLVGRDWQEDWPDDQIAQLVMASKEQKDASDIPKCVVCEKPIEGTIVSTDKGPAHEACAMDNGSKPPEPSEPPAPTTPPETPPAVPLPANKPEERPPKRFQNWESLL